MTKGVNDSDRDGRGRDPRRHPMVLAVLAASALAALSFAALVLATAALI